MNPVVYSPFKLPTYFHKFLSGYQIKYLFKKEVSMKKIISQASFENSRRRKQFYINCEVLLALCVVFLSACGSPEPTVDPVQVTKLFETEVSKAVTEAVPLPSATFTETVVPSLTPTITITPTITPKTIGGWEPPSGNSGWGNPWGTPSEIWNGIPIIPDAVAGGEVNDGKYVGYYYSVEKTLSEVRQYYQQELGKNGYDLSALGEDDNTIKLVFTNSEDQIVINAVSIDRDYEEIVIDYKGKKEVIITPAFHGSWVLIEH